MAGALIADGCRRIIEDMLPSSQLPVMCAQTTRAQDDMAMSASAHLRKLAEYEQVCGGVFVSRHMLFAPTPTTTDEAHALALEMAETLKEFAKYHVPPLVVMEPTSAAGAILNLKDYRAGSYDDALNAYFSNLKTAGVTDEMMGMWTVFPEANTPVWHTTNAEDFAVNVTKTISIQKKHFPTSKATILLNSLSYPDNDEQWQHGSFRSLLPYVKDLPPGLIDSFGYQGFPWSRPANDQSGPSLMDAKDFLQEQLAVEAAKALGVHEVWVNTGTFRQSYVSQAGETVTISPEKRSQILRDILGQAKQLKEADFAVAIHIFAEDKSKMNERVDWSYWQVGKPQESSSTSVFKSFVNATQDADIAVWLYDSANTQDIDE